MGHGPAQDREVEAKKGEYIHSVSRTPGLQPGRETDPVWGMGEVPHEADFGTRP